MLPYTSGCIAARKSLFLSRLELEKEIISKLIHPTGSVFFFKAVYTFYLYVLGLFSGWHKMAEMELFYDWHGF